MNMKDQDPISILEMPREAILQGILSYQNPNADYYRSIIPNPDTILGFETEFSERLIQFIEGNNQLLASVKKRLQGSSLFDLGGGRGYLIERLAVQSQAQMYCNVDLGLYPGKTDEKAQGTRIIGANNDMLEFLSRMDPNFVSACFSINGIDHTIIRDNEAYHEAVAQEISRVVQDGIVFGAGSKALSYLPEVGFSTIDQFDLGRLKVGVYEKKGSDHGSPLRRGYEGQASPE